MLPDTSRDKPHDGDQDAPTASDQLAREQAIQQIGRRRRFRFWAVLTLFMIFLTAIWAITQYHNAVGWPTNGFSQSNSGWGYPDVWNPWIIWPAMVWVLATTGYAWFVYGRRPVPERDQARGGASAGPAALTADGRRSVGGKGRCGHGHGECGRAGRPAGESF